MNLRAADTQALSFRFARMIVCALGAMLALAGQALAEVVRLEVKSTEPAFAGRDVRHSGVSTKSFAPLPTIGSIPPRESTQGW